MFWCFVGFLHFLHFCCIFFARGKPTITVFFLKKQQGSIYSLSYVNLVSIFFLNLRTTLFFCFSLDGLKFCVCLCVFPGLASGLEITTTGPSSIEKASGQSVKLECQFTLASEDTGPLDIEWSLMASDNQQEDKVVCVDLILHLSFLLTLLLTDRFYQTI